MKNLMPLIEFICEINKNRLENFITESTIVSYNKIVKYTNFLKQPLELWMFIPCDEDGNVLEEPNRYNEFLKLSKREGFTIWHNQCKKYQEAKERCLFEGFEIVKDKYKSCERESIYLPNTETRVWRKITFHTGEIQTFFFDYYEQFRIIEDLVKYKLQLTDNACKKIKL